ncbi:MAG: hypothetical protein KDA24_14030 [Deltaproteobacteria bacterium]|nr:hypothetical protein [Deltaproteobacteria bacterium]
MKRAAALCLLIAGCGTATAPDATAPDAVAPEPPAEPGTPTAPDATPPAAPDGPVVALADNGPPMVVLPKGLSPLYEDFFRDPDALTAFSKRLGTVLDNEQRVTVEVVWTEERLEGVITLLVPDADDVGNAFADQIDAGGVVDPMSIQPLVGSVGSWRADLGNRFDLRLLSFETRTVFWDHVSGSRCWMKGPMNDPEGTALAECFSCMLPGGAEEQVCRDGDAWPAALKGSKRAVSMLSSALRPGT